MSINLNRKGSGFTIIEVVLVLAIASIIFLLVFLAVPALQASQRDTARKNDVAKVVTSLANYAGNNAGSITSASKDNITSYAGALSANSTVNSSTTVAATADQTALIGKIDVYKTAKCGAVNASDSTKISVVLATANNAAVVTLLETGNVAFCQSL
jgi:prepilin-type N-terminal cleavage/methylation domain-containing protein